MKELEQISDYSLLVQNITPSRINSKPGWDGIFSAVDKQFNDLDASNYQLFNNIWIDTAEGVQLDLVGKDVEIARNGRDDETYRSLIKLKIDINIGSGQPELVIRAIKTLYNATEVHYIPNYPAAVIIQQDGSIGLFLLTEMEIDDGTYLLLDDGNPLFIREPDTSAEIILDLLMPAGVALQIVNI